MKLFSFLYLILSIISPGFLFNNLRFKIVLNCEQVDLIIVLLTFSHLFANFSKLKRANLQ